MTKRILTLFVLTLGLLLSAASAQAFSEGGGELMHAHANIKDKASLQRGAKLYFNYCSGCHSLHYMRYSRMARDLGLTKKEVMNNLNFTGSKFRSHALSAMPRADAKNWFGKPPPDLSLKVREKGADYVYSYLNSFYLDTSRPVGWNNTVFPNASMPNPLWELQGLQVPVMSTPKKGEKAEVEKLKLAQPGRMTPEQYHDATHDLTAFLTYVAEPAALQRHAMGLWVLLYLAAFTLLAYMLKHEYWKDIH